LKVFVVLLFLVPFSCLKAQRNIDFNQNWQFQKGYFNALYVDSCPKSGWRNLNLPHDWSIEDLPGPDSDSKVGPFSKISPGGSSTAHTIGGTAWYRKRFQTEKGDKDKKILLHFDGIYRMSTVYLNGQKLGFQASGYMPFWYELSKNLKPEGQENEILVQVVNEGNNSRWYAGSGIYRNVTLHKLPQVHIPLHGIYITTPSVSSLKATVKLEVEIQNTTKISESILVNIQLLDGAGKTYAKKQFTKFITPGTNSLGFEMGVLSPKLWSSENPHLYSAKIEIYSKGKLTDQFSQNFGIRKLEFSAEKGFLLNGKQVKMKGGCLHHDNGILGAAAYKTAEERRVKLMKANGFNAIRCAHNPPSQFFLDACDKEGMLVIDEAFDTWTEKKKKDDYHQFFNEYWKKDLTSMLLRDRNHPSIVVWSIGNEIPERSDSLGLVIGKQLVDFVHLMDPTRPVTNALNSFWDRPKYAWEKSIPSFKLLDIGGYNYASEHYASDHISDPKRMIITTESTPKLAYDYWKFVEENPYILGDFVWTGMDHLGEAGIGSNLYLTKDSIFYNPLPWPWFNSNCGDVDLIGGKKPQSHYHDVLWDNSQLEMAVHRPVPKGKIDNVSYWGWPDEYQSWNWQGAENDSLGISVYTKADKVRLLLNGKVIGEKLLIDSNKLKVHFKHAFQSGELKAQAFVKEKLIAEKSIKTTGKAFKIKLMAEQTSLSANPSNISFIRIEVQDEQGNVVPNTLTNLKLSISGQGELIASGNAHPFYMESYQDKNCKTHLGRALAIVRSNGKKGNIVLEVKAEGLLSDQISISSN